MAKSGSVLGILAPDTSLGFEQSPPWLKVGHHLGLARGTDKDRLMYESAPHGRRITRIEADRINRTGTVSMVADPFA